MTTAPETPKEPRSFASDDSQPAINAAGPRFGTLKQNATTHWTVQDRPQPTQDARDA